MILGCPNTILLGDIYWGTAGDALSRFPGRDVTFDIQSQLSLCHRSALQVSCAGMVCMTRGSSVDTVWHMRWHWTYGCDQGSRSWIICPVYLSWFDGSTSTSNPKSVGVCDILAHGQVGQFRGVISGYCSDELL